MNRRFNAATARRPWRMPPEAGGPETAALASMRPRPEGRGECPGRRPAKEPPDVASMRPRPEGRGESTTPTRFEAARTSLQCGHGPKAVENLSFYPHGGLFEDASMRPRPEGRGECASSGWFPKLTRRLQCGHGPK